MAIGTRLEADAECIGIGILVHDNLPYRPEDQPRPYVRRAAWTLLGEGGFVFSPFNHRMVDVSDIPSGTLVADPTDPASEKKYFRVP